MITIRLAEDLSYRSEEDGFGSIPKRYYGIIRVFRQSYRYIVLFEPLGFHMVTGSRPMLRFRIRDMVDALDLSFKEVLNEVSTASPVASPLLAWRLKVGR